MPFQKKIKGIQQTHSTGLPSDWSAYRFLKKLSERMSQSTQPISPTTLKPWPWHQSQTTIVIHQSRRQDNFGIPTLKDNNGTYNSYESRANVLNNYFSTVFTKESTDNLPTLDCSPYPPNDPLIITVNGIASLLSGLDVHKACGPDGIYPRLLKETAQNVSPMLTVLCQAS